MDNKHVKLGADCRNPILARTVTFRALDRNGYTLPPSHGPAMTWQ
jgi:hypothetical protein